MRTAKLLALIGLAALLVPGRGLASTSVTLTGSADIGNPAVSLVEATVACDPQDEANGFDGVWLDVSEYADFRAVLAMTHYADFDLRFYDADCAAIDYSAMGQQGGGQPEIGKVPTNAAYAFVHFFSGRDGRFELTLY